MKPETEEVVPRTFVLHFVDGGEATIVSATPLSAAFRVVDRELKGDRRIVWWVEEV